MTQLPPPSRRSLKRDPIYLRRVKPAAFGVAAFIIVCVGVIELGMLCSIFYLRSQVITVDTSKVPKAKPGYETHPVEPTPAPTTLVGNSTTPSKPETAPASENTQPLVQHIAQNNNGSATVLAIQVAPNIFQGSAEDRMDRINAFLDDAKLQVSKHQNQKAEESLHKAETLDPRSIYALEALAKFYDSTGDAPMATQFWQRLVDQGPEIGSEYAEAYDQIKLKGKFSDPLRDQSQWPRQIFIRQVIKTQVKVENDEPVFHVQVELGRKDNKVAFDQRKLRPFVIFYQLLPDGTYKVDPQRPGTFEHAFLFSGTNSESFVVTYSMPTVGEPGSDGQPNGEYYGFVVGIYYDSNLQDARSEPNNLWTEKPLPDAIEQ